MDRVRDAADGHQDIVRIRGPMPRRPLQSSLTAREGFGRGPLQTQTIGEEPAGPIGRPNEKIDHNRTYITFAGTYNMTDRRPTGERAYAVLVELDDRPVPELSRRVASQRTCDMARAAR
jgi:hypothetical protein